MALCRSHSRCLVCVYCDGEGLRVIARRGGDHTGFEIDLVNDNHGDVVVPLHFSRSRTYPTLTFSFPQFIPFPSFSLVCLRVICCFFHVMDFVCGVPAHMSSWSEDRMRTGYVFVPSAHRVRWFPHLWGWVPACVSVSSPVCFGIWWGGGEPPHCA